MSSRCIDLSAASAFSIRPFRMSQRGDSGTNQMPNNTMTGKRSWKPMGKRYAKVVLTSTTPRFIAAAMICEMERVSCQHMRVGPRRDAGDISWCGTR